MDTAGGGPVLQTDFCFCERWKKSMLLGIRTTTALGSPGCRQVCVGRENNVVLIFISGFAKNQEDEISNFKMSH